MANLYSMLRGILPNPPLQVGTVTAFYNGVAQITMIDGGVAQALGDVAVGDKVFFKDGAIQGAAPDLPTEIIYI